MTTLYHVSGWSELASRVEGEQFTLVPGSQHAEGVGVYFSEGEARHSAAEGARDARQVSTVVIEASLNDASWYRSKACKARKTGKARTWHTDGKSITCTIVQRVDDCLFCSWNF